MEQSTEWKKSVKSLIYILFLLCEYAANSLFSGEWFIPLDLVCLSVTIAQNFDFLQMEDFLNIFNAQIGWEQDCQEPDMELGDMH